jgi:hypothetical protein
MANMELSTIFDGLTKFNDMKKKLLFNLFSLCLSSAFAQIPTSGLVASFPFTGNANDASGNGNNGIVSGATLTADRFGNANSAYMFNGTSNYIDLVINRKIDSISGDFSLSYWFNTSVNAYQSVLSSYSTQGWRFISRLTYDSAMTDFNAVPNISWQHVDTHAGAISLNTWENLIYVRTGTSYAVYLNGVLKSTGAVSANAINNPTAPYATTRIGYNCAGLGSEYFTGKIDDILFYNRALTLSEISSVYNVDICYQTVTVTDTLLIHMTVTGYNPVTYANTIKIFPNPAKDHITIDFSNYATQPGYSIKILNTLSQVVYNQALTGPIYTVALNTFGGAGTYFVQVYDGSSNLIDVRKIILQ